MSGQNFDVSGFAPPSQISNVKIQYVQKALEMTETPKVVFDTYPL